MKLFSNNNCWCCCVHLYRWIMADSTLPSNFKSITSEPVSDSKQSHLCRIRKISRQTVKWMKSLLVWRLRRWRIPQNEYCKILQIMQMFFFSSSWFKSTHEHISIDVDVVFVQVNLLNHKKDSLTWKMHPVIPESNKPLNFKWTKALVHLHQYKTLGRRNLSSD